MDRTYRDLLPPPICKDPLQPVHSPIFSKKQLDLIDRFSDEHNRTWNQHLLEISLLRTGTCDTLNPDVTDYLKLINFTFDDELLQDQLMSIETLNANLHANISCLVNSIVSDYKTLRRKNIELPFHRERVRDWFPYLKQLGPKSVEGVAVQTSLSLDTEMFVFKTPIKDCQIDSLVHEAIVGLYALNKLRPILPNFMYVYGYMRCSPLVLSDVKGDRTKEGSISDTANPITWCSDNGNSASYLILENIYGSVSFDEFILMSETSEINVMGVFLQIIAALNLANKHYGYTHYDLHSNNILIRKFDDLLAIPFYGATSEKLVGYIGTKFVPYIIDYGNSRIVLSGKSEDEANRAVSLSDRHNRNYAFPMHDIYKLICFLGQTLYYSQKMKSERYNQIIEMLEKMFSFFNEGTLLNRVENRGKHDYFAPSKKHFNITYADYIIWMQDNLYDYLPVNKLEVLLPWGIVLAPLNNKLNTCDFYNLFTTNLPPATNLEFCDVINALVTVDLPKKDRTKASIKRWLLDKFDPEHFYVDHVDLADEAFDYLKQLVKKFPEPMIPLLTVDRNLGIKQVILDYRARIINLLIIKDIVAEKLAFYRASRCALKIQEVYDMYQEEIEDALRALNEYAVNIENAAITLRENVKNTVDRDWTFIKDVKLRYFWETEHPRLVHAV